MARISKPGVLTGARGRVGNVVTYELNGVQIVRSLPAKKKKYKFTKLQQLYHARFQMMHRLAKSVKHEIINRIWNQLAVATGQNGYNMFIKANRMAFGGDSTVAFPGLLVLSKGDLYPVDNFAVKREGNELQFSWNNNYTGKYAYSSDSLNIVLLTERKVLKIVEIKATRDKEVATLPVPENEATIEGYAFWSSANEKYFSESVYWQV